MGVQQISVPSSGAAAFTADQPTWNDTGTAVQIQSGSLAGNIALLYQQSTNGISTTTTSGYLVGYGQQLDSLAQSLMSTVNQYQESGLNLSGQTTTDSAGQPLPFFSGTSAGTMAVNSAMSPNGIAAASNTASSGPGDGSNAAALYNALADGTTTVGSQSNTTLGGYYQSLVGQVGLDGQKAANLETDGQSTLTSLNNSLQAATGVDLNQQSVNMIQEQQSYEAAAKLITTEQSVISSLLSAVS
jgi:flagellar hook-associated protein 1 FlgK